MSVQDVDDALHVATIMQNCSVVSVIRASAHAIELAGRAVPPPAGLGMDTINIKLELSQADADRVLSWVSRRDKS